jgi:hypothetical protein
MLDDFAGDNDLKRVREIEFVEGQKLVLKCSDPYGFWTVHYPKGEVPDALKGSFTSFIEAEKQVRSYLNTLPPAKKREVKQVNQ